MSEIELGELEFKAEDFAGIMWRDDSGKEHYINENDAYQVADRANAILKEKLAKSPRLYGRHLGLGDGEPMETTEWCVEKFDATHEARIVCIKELS